MPWWPTSVLDALTRIEGKIEGLNRKLDTKADKADLAEIHDKLGKHDERLTAVEQRDALELEREQTKRGIALSVRQRAGVLATGLSVAAAVTLALVALFH